MISIDSGAVRKDFCGTTKKMNNLIGTEALFSDRHGPMSRGHFHDANLNLKKKGCEQKIQFGQKVTCSNYIPTSSIYNIQMYAVILINKIYYLSSRLNLYFRLPNIRL